MINPVSNENSAYGDHNEMMFIPPKWSKSNNENTKLESLCTNRHFYTLLMIEFCMVLQKQFGFSFQIKIRLLCARNYTSKYIAQTRQILITTKRHTRFFRTSLLLTAKTQKKYKCPTAGEWMHELHCIYAMKFILMHQAYMQDR